MTNALKRLNVIPEWISRSVPEVALERSRRHQDARALRVLVQDPAVQYPALSNQVVSSVDVGRSIFEVEQHNIIDTVELYFENKGCIPLDDGSTGVEESGDTGDETHPSTARHNVSFEQSTEGRKTAGGFTSTQDREVRVLLGACCSDCARSFRERHQHYGGRQASADQQRKCNGADVSYDDD